MKKKKWLKRFIVFSIFFGLVGMYLSREEKLKVRELSMEYPLLPKDFENMKILHVSDLHADEFNLIVWEEILKADCDMALFTGDYITTYPEKLLPHLESCKKLAQKVPVYFSFGNHDTDHKEEISTMLTSQGWQLLDMERKEIESPNGKSTMAIIGVDDWYSLKRKAFRGLDELIDPVREEVFMLLSHQPQIVDDLVGDEKALVFSGHTHGGQIRLPFFPVLYAPGQGFFPKYGHGFYERENIKLHITSGIGSTRFFIRTFNPPEIVILTLKSKA